MSWNPIDCSNQNGPNFGYEVDLQRMDGANTPSGTVTGTMFSVSGLQPFTNYTFRVRAVNSAGNGDYTPLRAIQTDQDSENFSIINACMFHKASSKLKYVPYC